jgi:hypothetical protein
MEASVNFYRTAYRHIREDRSVRPVIMKEKWFHCFEISEPLSPATQKEKHPHLYSKFDSRRATIFVIADFLNVHCYFVPLRSISLQELC